MNEIVKDMEAEYDNSGRVENASQLIDSFISDAADYRNEAARLIDFGQSYGPKERNKLDLFWPGEDKPDKSAPIVMFIHGGYWQRLDRAAFSHMAKGLNAHGIAVAIPSYTLCPDIKISGIIDELRRACIVLWKTYDCQITVCGHSAGGHLAACMLATNWNRIHNSLPEKLVTSALSISGVFDLAPLIETSLNAALKLTQEEARTASPYNWIIDHDLHFDAWVGGDESDEFLRQSRSQAQRWRMMGAKTRYQEIAGANHFTAVAPLTDPDSAMVKRLLELMQPATSTTLDELNIPAHQPLPISQTPDKQTETETETENISISEEANVEEPPTDQASDNEVKDNDATVENKSAENVDDEKKSESVAAEPESPDKQPAEDEASNNSVDKADQSDDLTLISGIGEKLQSRLHELGFFTFVQIAELSATQQEMIEGILDFKDRIQRDNWIEQARDLAIGKQPANED